LLNLINNIVCNLFPQFFFEQFYSEGILGELSKVHNEAWDLHYVSWAMKFSSGYHSLLPQNARHSKRIPEIP